MRGSRGFEHRERLTVVPSGGFIEVLRDSNEDVGDVPEYMPLSLLNAVPAAGLSPVVLPAASQILSGAGAISLTTFKTDFTSTGVGDALTLADGTIVGQMKRILHKVDGGSGALTPTNLSDGTSITFTAAGTVVELIWDGSTWSILDNYNIIDGVTLATIVA